MAGARLASSGLGLEMISMGERYTVGTWVLNDIESESPGQIPYSPGPNRGTQRVVLNSWQYDLVVNHCERVLYSGGANVDRKLAAARASAYNGTLNRLLAHGDPVEAELRREGKSLARSNVQIQEYPEFDGTQACAEIGVEIMYGSERGGVVSHGERASNDRPEAVSTIVCKGCDFLGECLIWALHHEEYGVWGGTTASQRARMRSRLGIELVDPYVVATYGSNAGW